VSIAPPWLVRKYPVVFHRWETRATRKNEHGDFVEVVAIVYRPTANEAIAALAAAGYTFPRDARWIP
jgi:hypothetical protein